jgi:hypothetical protein
MIFIKDNHPVEVNLLKIIFIFDKKWYEKYDRFKLGNVEYICVSRPKKNEDNTWSIEAIPLKISWKDGGGYDTEFIKNNLSELYS